MTPVILFNKPFQVLCQFSPQGEKSTLKTFIPIPGFYPCGRLDYDSEGLLILSNKGSLQSLISQPKHKMAKTYWVQVEGSISDQALKQLAQGVELKDGLTRPAEAARMDEPADLWPRDPPIRDRKSVPTSWLALTISEGKNRQVRRMTAAVGFPTLRLIRYRVGPWSLADIAPGEWRYGELDSTLKEKLKYIENNKVANKPTTKVNKPGKPRATSGRGHRYRNP